MSILAPSPAQTAYDVMAPFYDDLTSHHDYDHWTRRLLDLAARHGVRGPGRLLDLACGTGKSFLPLLAQGWDVVGGDLSEAMLDRCRAKVGGAVALHRLDVRDVPELGSFDVVWAIDDIVNYVVDPEDLTPMFAGMARNIGPGGLVMFDANTLSMYRGFFAATEVAANEDLVTVWRGLAGQEFAAAELAEARLEVFERDGAAWARHTSVHSQRHHPEPVVRDALSKAGLRCVGAYGQSSTVEFDEHIDEQRHIKAIYLATMP